MISLLKAFIGFVIGQIKSIFTSIVQDTVFEYFVEN